MRWPPRAYADPIGFILDYLSVSGPAALIDLSTGNVERSTGQFKVAPLEQARKAQARLDVGTPIVAVDNRTAVGQVGFRRVVVHELDAPCADFSKVRHRISKGCRAIKRLLDGSFPPTFPEADGGASGPPKEAVVFDPSSVARPTGEDEPSS